MGSFYDLDYLIKINEDRLEQYSNFYQKNIDKFTTILVLYSGLAIFLIPMIQTLFFTAVKCHWLYYFSFCVFILLLIVSVINTIRLMIPAQLLYLREPKLYYIEYKKDYELESIPQNEVDTLLKSSYIQEIEKAIKDKMNLFKRKEIFYNKAFIYAVFSCIPYLICIGFQLSIQK